MNQILKAVFQITAFLLFQTVLLHLVGQNKYEKYIRTFSGFLLILLLFSAIRSLWGGGDLLTEVEQQINFVTEEEDFKLRLRQAEESQQLLLKESYEKRILEEVERCLEEERYFLAEGTVSFTSEWKLARLQLMVSKTWKEQEEKNAFLEDDIFWSKKDFDLEHFDIENDEKERYGNEDDEDVTEIWIEPVEPIAPVEMEKQSEKTELSKKTELSEMTETTETTKTTIKTTEEKNTETAGTGRRAEESEGRNGEEEGQRKESKKTESRETESGETEEDWELARLRSRLANRLGIDQNQIYLSWKEGG